MTVGILAEKSSAAKAMAKALGGMSGTFNGEKYVIAYGSGHVYEFQQPHLLVPKDKQDQYKKWDVSLMPWDPQDFTWKRKVGLDQGGKSLQPRVDDIKSKFSGCDEIVIATDIDPTGEGQLIAWEIIDELKMHDKKITRMSFTDESEDEFRRAFIEREVLPAMHEDPEFLKADFRTKFDMLSMQFTRAASIAAGQKATVTVKGKPASVPVVLREGRLKSPIVWIVGQRWDEINNYKRVPFFQNRYRDDHGVVYTDPDQPRFDAMSKVPQEFSDSTVVVDSKTMKKKAPPKLLNLAKLDGLLSREGYKSPQVLATYQKMYEETLLSYPRTEDENVTPGQFQDLLPKIDQIAGVVSVDPKLLTHREPRSTHVKAKGAHGANRPGPKVPASLDEVEAKHGKLGRRIYEILAKNYLSIHAPDYEFELQKGHVADHPTFVGSASVPKVMGYKAVFSDEEIAEDENADGLGTKAEPFVHEGAPTKPAVPTKDWLYKQLDKRSIGTGATQVSTVGEVTSTKARFPLLTEDSKGRLSMSEYGTWSYYILRDTHIGDLSTTEFVYDQMDQVAAKTLRTNDALQVIGEWVKDDILTMKNNGEAMRKELKLSNNDMERVDVTFDGETKSIKRTWGPNEHWDGHTFTDAEIKQLEAGETVSFDAVNRSGDPYKVTGKLGYGEFNGKEIFGFQLEKRKDDAERIEVEINGQKRMVKKTWGANEHWKGHTFTDGEIRKMADGQQIEFEAVSKKNKPYTAKGTFGEGSFNGKTFYGFQLNFD